MPPVRWLPPAAYFSRPGKVGKSGLRASPRDPSGTRTPCGGSVLRVWTTAFYQSRARTGQTSFSFGPYRGVGSAQWQGCSYGGSLLHSNPRVSTKADGLVIPLLQSAGLTETDAGLKPGSSHFCGFDCGWLRAEGSRASVRDTASAISRRGPGASPWFPFPPLSETGKWGRRRQATAASTSTIAQR